MRESNNIQEEEDYLVIVTVGSTSFQGLVENVLDLDFLASLDRLVTSIGKAKVISHDGKSSDKIRLMVQIGHSNLTLSNQLIQRLAVKRRDQETHYLNQIELDRFNSNQSATPLNLQFTGLNDNPREHQFHNRMELIIFKFSFSIDLLLSFGHLIITHAGAGSILSAIKPMNFTNTRRQKIKDSSDGDLKIDETIKITEDFNITINHGDVRKRSKLMDKQVIIVPNYSLMDNHQLDLAHEISDLGLAHSCPPGELIKTLTEIEKEIKVGGNQQLEGSSNLNNSLLSNNDCIDQSFSSSSATKLKKLLDLQSVYFLASNQTKNNH